MAQQRDENLVTMSSVQALGGALIVVMSLTTVVLACAAFVALSGATRWLVFLSIALHNAAVLMMFGVLRVEAQLERKQQQEVTHLHTFQI